MTGEIGMYAALGIMFGVGFIMGTVFGLLVSRILNAGAWHR